VDYTSNRNERKNYEGSFHQYERELKVPYYLLFSADDKVLTLYRHNKRRYVVARFNKHGRYPIRELDLEVGLLDGWVRYWYEGALLPLPADLQRDLDESRRQVEAEKRRADELQQRLDAAERELAELRARLKQ
jgi:hypothetical protein